MQNLAWLIAPPPVENSATFAVTFIFTNKGSSIGKRGIGQVLASSCSQRLKSTTLAPITFKSVLEGRISPQFKA